MLLAALASIVDCHVDREWMGWNGREGGGQDLAVHEVGGELKADGEVGHFLHHASGGEAGVVGGAAGDKDDAATALDVFNVIHLPTRQSEHP
jgi:hypothetical protein